MRATGAPTLSLGAGANSQYAEVNGGEGRRIEGGRGSLDLTMPLYRPQVGVAVEQAGAASRSAEVQVSAAEQDLLLRTALAYLEVLARSNRCRRSPRRRTHRGAARIGAPELRGGHGDHRRSQRGAVALRPRGRAGDQCHRRTGGPARRARPADGAQHGRFYKLPSEAALPPVRPAVQDEWLELARERNRRSAEPAWIWRSPSARSTVARSDAAPRSMAWAPYRAMSTPRRSSAGCARTPC